MIEAFLRVTKLNGDQVPYETVIDSVRKVDEFGVVAIHLLDDAFAHDNIVEILEHINEERTVSTVNLYTTGDWFDRSLYIKARRTGVDVEVVVLADWVLPWGDGSQGLMGTSNAGSETRQIAQLTGGKIKQTLFRENQRDASQFYKIASSTNVSWEPHKPMTKQFGAFDEELEKWVEQLRVDLTTPDEFVLVSSDAAMMTVGGNVPRYQRQAMLNTSVDVIGPFFVDFTGTCRTPLPFDEWDGETHLTSMSYSDFVGFAEYQTQQFSKYGRE